MMFCFRNILQIWIILIVFRDANDFLNLGICKHEFKFTCPNYCRFTLRVNLDKCIFSAKELVFSEFTLPGEGISPDQAKVQAIHDAKIKDSN